MNWFGSGNRIGGERPLTYEDVVRAVRAEIDPLRTSIATLQTDTRADMVRLEAKMDAGFASIDVRYVTQAASRERETATDRRFVSLEAQIDALQKAPANASAQTWVKVGIISSLVVGGFALFIQLLVQLAHVSYHP